MPPSPVKRYRQKSRLRRGDAGADLRQKALDMAQKGLRSKMEASSPHGGFQAGNRRGGPVDKGPPAEQQAAAQRLKNEHAQALGEMQRQKQVQGTRPQTEQAPKASTGDRTEVNRNKNNPRAGQRFRTILRRGGEVHQYAGGKSVFVRKPAASRTTGPTEGTGNRTKPATRGSQDLANELARQRATQNRPKARRKLFSRA
jgi:hypothetical protein